MKIFSVFTLFLFTSLQMLANERETLSFNAGWRLHIGEVEQASQSTFDDSSWKAVTLPHAWNEDEAFSKAIDGHSTGIVWYRKRFTVPATHTEKKVFLEFEGIRQGGEFYLNGQHIGRHENGVMAFGFDLTVLLKKGEENVIAIRIDNDWRYREKATNSTYQWNNINFNANYGGIPKNVWIHFTPKVYQTLPLFNNLGTTGVYIYAKDFNINKREAQVVAESQVKNESNTDFDGQYVVDILDKDRKLVKSFSRKIRILANSVQTVSANALMKDMHFWSWGYGYLYEVKTRLVRAGHIIDEVATNTGFRKTEFRDGQIFLNDRVLMIKGYAQRTSNEWPAVGLSVAPWLSDYSNKLMVESNGNAVRWMHVTPWKQDVESCDRVGLIQVMPAGDAEKDVVGRQWEQRLELMREAIVYFKNNPSILFYESGNESISESHMAEMKAIRDRFDPYGGRAIGSREMLDSKIAEYGGEMLYINKSSTHPMFATEYMRDEGLRKYWDEYTYPFHPDGEGPLYKGNDASDYNRNQDSHALEAVRRWWEYWQYRPGTGKRVSSGGVNIIFSDSNTHYRGKENYRRSGEVDAMRIPKDAFYAHQVMWDGWVDTKPEGLHIVGHWNYAKGTQKDVYVIAAGEKVELLVNGQSQGFGKRSHNFLFTFPGIRFEVGSISAKSYDKNGKVLNEKVIKTTGDPYRLKLTYRHGDNGLYADANDMVLLEVEVLDKNGLRVPTALNTIDFKVKGPVEWRGGIAQGPNNYILSESLPVEGGVNRALLRTRYNESGMVKVIAQSNGLLADTVEFTVQDIQVQNDYFVKLSSQNLPVNLDRGPSPMQPTVTPTRETLTIKQAKAGANQLQAQQSFDNNELSDWVNDGNLNTAWIEYTLAKADHIDEIDLKLNNFRTRTYPLQVFVDDSLVYEGVTERTLGYFTLKLPRSYGSRVKIQLKDTSSTLKETQHAEMGGQKLDDGVTRNDANATGRLSIIEIDIHKQI